MPGRFPKTGGILESGLPKAPMQSSLVRSSTPFGEEIPCSGGQKVLLSLSDLPSLRSLLGLQPIEYPEKPKIGVTHWITHLRGR